MIYSTTFWLAMFANEYPQSFNSGKADLGKVRQMRILGNVYAGDSSCYEQNQCAEGAVPHLTQIDFHRIYVKLHNELTTL